MVSNLVLPTITFYTLLNTINGYGLTTAADKDSSESSSKNHFLKEGAIFPGTNWCGAGTIAEEYSKLGSYGGADKCCRQHDLGCPAFIRSGHTKYGLYNYKMWTLNHCTCDERFRSCLKMVNSARADMVGRFFFNVIRIPCFVFSKTEKCTSWTWWGKCIHKEKKRHAVLRQPMSYATNGFFWERNESEISRQKCFHHYFKNHTSHNEIYTVCNPPWIMILCILW